MVNTVGVVLHPGRDCNSAMLELLAWDSGRKVTVLADKDEARRVPGHVEEVTPLDLASRSDLMVSLGGDGTMLRAMRMSCGPKPPVLGVNVGKLGFLAEIDPPEMAEALCAIDEHRFTVERSAVRAEFPASRRRVQRRGPGPHPRPRVLHPGRAHHGVASVRAVRGGRGDRGHAHRVHRL
jgi:NAD+ kinase